VRHRKYWAQKGSSHPAGHRTANTSQRYPPIRKGSCCLISRFANGLNLQAGGDFPKMVSRQQIHLLGRARRGCLCQSRANRRPRTGTGSQLEGYEKNWSPGFVGRISARRISTDLALREQRGNLRDGSQSTLTRASALLDSNGANQVCWHYFRLAVTRPKTGFGFCEGLDPSLSMPTSFECATTSMSPVIEFLLSGFGVHS
jgi:hypothetical protein